MYDLPDMATMPYRDKVFGDLLVGDVFERIVKEPAVVHNDSSIREAIDKMIQNPMSRKVYVVDSDGKYMGTVTTETILRLLGYRVGVRDSSSLSFIRFLRDALKEDVERIMVRSKTVTKDTKLSKAINIMFNEHLNDLPVVDAQGKLIGELISLELFIEGRELFDENQS